VEIHGSIQLFRHRPVVPSGMHWGVQAVCMNLAGRAESLQGFLVFWMAAGGWVRYFMHLIWH